MGTRKASIKETGEELSPEEWERFDQAVAAEKARRRKLEGAQRERSMAYACLEVQREPENEARPRFG